MELVDYSEVAMFFAIYFILCLFFFFLLFIYFLYMNLASLTGMNHSVSLCCFAAEKLALV